MADTIPPQSTTLPPQSPPVPPIQVTVPPPVIPPIPIPTDVPMSLPPTTTMQEDVNTASQRRISLIWEITQSTIAVIITATVMYGALRNDIHEPLSDAFFLIIGFYFSRTNHAAIGGIGPKATDTAVYVGR